jgi:hypothetical protein
MEIFVWLEWQGSFICGAAALSAYLLLIAA